MIHWFVAGLIQLDSVLLVGGTYIAGKRIRTLAARLPPGAFVRIRTLCLPGAFVRIRTLSPDPDKSSTGMFCPPDPDKTHDLHARSKFVRIRTARYFKLLQVLKKIPQCLSARCLQRSLALRNFFQHFAEV